MRGVVARQTYSVDACRISIVQVRIGDFVMMMVGDDFAYRPPQERLAGARETCVHPKKGAFFSDR
jgi:hypothetical protein